MTGRRVVLWRHGQTAWNLAERFQGSSDVELDEVGVAQAGRAARLLTTLAPAAIVSSDLLDLPLDRWAVVGGLANCSWSVLEEAPPSGWRLVEHNAGSLPEPVRGDEE